MRKLTCVSPPSGWEATCSRSGRVRSRTCTRHTQHGRQGRRQSISPSTESLLRGAPLENIWEHFLHFLVWLLLFPFLSPNSTRTVISVHMPTATSESSLIPFPSSKSIGVVPAAEIGRLLGGFTLMHAISFSSLT